MDEGDKIAAQQSGIVVRRDQRRWGRRREGRHRNLPLSLWIKVWDHRIRRRRGISCADASDDVLDDGRVRSPRQHIRAKLAGRRIKFAREGHNGGKALGIALCGLVDELDRDRLGPRSLSRFAALDDRDLFVQMLGHIGPKGLGALWAAAQVAGLSRFELTLAWRPLIARDMIVLIGHGAPPFLQARARQSRRSFRHGSRGRRSSAANGGWRRRHKAGRSRCRSRCGRCPRNGSSTMSPGRSRVVSLSRSTCVIHVSNLDQETRLGYIRQKQSVFTAMARGLVQATASGIRWFSTTYPGFSEPSSVLQCARKFLWDQDRSKIRGPTRAR